MIRDLNSLRPSTHFSHFSFMFCFINWTPWSERSEDQVCRHEVADNWPFLENGWQFFAQVTTLFDVKTQLLETVLTLKKKRERKEYRFIIHWWWAQLNWKIVSKRWILLFKRKIKLDNAHFIIPQSSPHLSFTNDFIKAFFFSQWCAIFNGS